jgi:hypothetical protein
MTRELKNASITHVSYVDKGANQKTFFFMKSDKNDHPDFKKHVEVFVNKDEAEQQLVYGVVYEPDVEDSHGDFMTAPEIEKAAHGFMKDARNIDTQHDFQEGVGEVVESYIAPCDMEIGGHDIAKGSWVLVTKATEEIWDSIKKGEYTGYSMAGKAETIEKQSADPVSAPNESEMAGFFNALKSFFSPKEKVQKGDVAEKYNQDRRRREFWAAQEALNSVIFNWGEWNSELESDSDKIREALQDFVDIAQDVLLQDDILKALGQPPDDKEETDVKKEDLEKMLDDKFAPIQKRLEDLEKEENPEPNANGAEGGKEDLPKQLGDILDQKLAPLTDRIEKVEQARGVTKQSGDDPHETDVKKSASLWDGVL